MKIIDINNYSQDNMMYFLKGTLVRINEDIKMISKTKNKKLINELTEMANLVVKAEKKILSNKKLNNDDLYFINKLIKYNKKKNQQLLIIALCSIAGVTLIILFDFVLK